MAFRWSTQKNIPHEHLDGLFQTIGWKKRGEDKWREALEKSSHVISVWDGEKLVGLGRILEDGVMCMFYDIGVHPDYQRRRIGSKILNRLISKVKNKNYASIGLFVWEENSANIPFYQEHGFERVKTGMELVRHMQRE